MPGARACRGSWTGAVGAVASPSQAIAVEEDEPPPADLRVVGKYGVHVGARQALGERHRDRGSRRGSTPLQLQRGEPIVEPRVRLPAHGRWRDHRWPRCSGRKARAAMSSKTRSTAEAWVLAVELAAVGDVQIRDWMTSKVTRRGSRRAGAPRGPRRRRRVTHERRRVASPWSSNSCCPTASASVPTTTST